MSCCQVCVSTASVECLQVIVDVGVWVFEARGAVCVSTDPQAVTGVAGQFGDGQCLREGVHQGGGKTAVQKECTCVSLCVCVH